MAFKLLLPQQSGVCVTASCVVATPTDVGIRKEHRTFIKVNVFYLMKIKMEMHCQKVVEVKHFESQYQTREN
jgi:hypothetical protein